MFITSELIARLRSNIQSDPAVAAVTANIADRAAHWRALSDDALWDLMYGATLFRSWDVWSTGHCPTCKADTPLYAWKFDAIAKPWKTTCPHCDDVFPKNDFAAYHRSGLDAHGIFQRELADRSLLFNVEHPDPSDPLHQYAVDDGWGYVGGENRWFFIAAYLIYGQWRQLVYAGIMNLTAAYVVTNDQADARKALILLDRLADLYPSFNFKTQAIIEEKFDGEGYVTVWHDAAPETKQLALAFACVRHAIDGDSKLVEFLSGKARRYGLPNSKGTAADVRRNIEDGLLRDPLKNVHKIHSNYPTGELAQMVLHGVLGGPEHERAMQAILDAVLERATAVDGITGEKGLSGYAVWTIEPLAVFLAMLERVRPGMLAESMRRFPALRQTYRFHIDTWCQQLYYPQVGDSLGFGARVPEYAAFRMARLRPDKPVHSGLDTLLTPSMFDFAWRLYEVTGDVAYAQLVHYSNGRQLDGLPHDLYATDGAGFRQKVAAVIKSHGPEIHLGNSLKRQWCVGLLRSGKGARERTLWSCFDSGGSHSHANALNIGLFAKGFDFMPDFGYPPLQFSHWDGPHSMWYRTTAAHNTVVVDGAKQAANRSQAATQGECTLWGDGREVAAMCVSAEVLFVVKAITEPAPLYAADRDRVGLYADKPSRFRRVRVYTRPVDASGDWTLAFEDDFRRAELGPDWRSMDGENRWSVRDGAVAGHGALICTRSFPGRQRIEYEAETSETEPCDLSAFLLASQKGLTQGVFFGFGSGNNDGSKLVVHMKDAGRSNARIKAGSWHRVQCECDGDEIRFHVDGNEILRFENTAQSIRREFEAARRERQYQRTLVRLDVSDADSYYADIFRVAGGRDHAKFTHGTFARVESRGLAVAPGKDFGFDSLLRNSKTDPQPSPGWSVEWKLASWREFVELGNVPHDKVVSGTNASEMAAEPPPGSDLRMRVTELTNDAEATLCEAWIAPGSYSTKTEAWIPCVIARRRAENAPLVSTFVSTIEAFDGAALIRQSRRLSLATPSGAICGDDHVALEVSLVDGRTDLLLFVNSRNPLNLKPDPKTEGGVVQSDWDVRFDGELAVIRRGIDGRVASVALGNARSLQMRGLVVKLKPDCEWIEIRFDGFNAEIISGDASAVVELKA